MKIIITILSIISIIIPAAVSASTYDPNTVYNVMYTISNSEYDKVDRHSQKVIEKGCRLYWSMSSDQIEASVDSHNLYGIMACKISEMFVKVVIDTGTSESYGVYEIENIRTEELNAKLMYVPRVIDGSKLVLDGSWDIDANKLIAMTSNEVVKLHKVGLCRFEFVEDVTEKGNPGNVVCYERLDDIRIKSIMSSYPASLIWQKIDGLIRYQIKPSVGGMQ